MTSQSKAKFVADRSIFSSTPDLSFIFSSTPDLSILFTSEVLLLEYFEFYQHSTPVVSSNQIRGILEAFNNYICCLSSRSFRSNKWIKFEREKISCRGESNPGPSVCLSSVSTYWAILHLIFIVLYFDVGLSNILLSWGQLRMHKLKYP
jgi:hypothetical protein